MRKIQVIGNITKDAEVKHFEGGKSVINMDLAVNEQFLRNGIKEKKVYYIKCAIWRENTSIAQYLLKGVKVYVEGTPDVEAYVNKEGKAIGNVKVNVREIEFCGGTKKPETSTSTTPTNSNDDFPSDDPNSDLPF